MKRTGISYAFSLLVLAFALFLTTSPGAASGPLPGRQGLDDSGAMRISDSDRCPVCAMKVSHHPDFSCAIQLKNGTTYYFCGTGCMIRSWLHPERFLAVKKEDIQRSVVRDYFTGAACDAGTVTWVAGSDVVGPMGPAVVPIQNERDVSVFQRRHGGTSTFRLLELTDERWEAISGKRASSTGR